MVKILEVAVEVWDKISFGVAVLKRLNRIEIYRLGLFLGMLTRVLYKEIKHLLQCSFSHYTIILQNKHQLNKLKDHQPTS